MWWWRQRLELCSCKPGCTKDCQQTTRSQGEGRKDSSLGFRESMPLPTPWSWTSSLQNCEGTHFCCFMPPSLWYFVIAALGNKYTCSEFWPTDMEIIKGCYLKLLSFWETCYAATITVHRNPGKRKLPVGKIKSCPHHWLYQGIREKFLGFGFLKGLSGLYLALQLCKSYSNWG